MTAAGRQRCHATRRSAGLIACLIGVLAMMSSLDARAQQASVQARLSTGTISLDETVTLSVSARDASGKLDTSDLESRFDVVSRSQSSQVSIINGVRSDTVNWALELVPRRTGVFTVPPVRIGKLESELLTLTVTAAPTGADQLVFMKGLARHHDSAGPGADHPHRARVPLGADARCVSRRTIGRWAGRRAARRESGRQADARGTRVRGDRAALRGVSPA